LRAFDPATDVVAMRRNAERLLEGAAEIVGAQMNELRQRIERYRLGEVFLDVRGNETLLPNSKATPHRRCAARNDAMAAQQLMRDHHAKRLAITIGIGARLDRCRELDRRVPQWVVFEEQARRERG